MTATAGAGESRSVTVEVGSAGVYLHGGAAELKVEASTDKWSRVREIEKAAAAIAAANDLGPALVQIRRALAAIHGLNDDRHKRSLWSYDSWSVADRELWEAHLGARHASHHENWTPIVLVSNDSGRGFPWASNMPAVDKESQRKAYLNRLEGQNAVPGLRDIATIMRATLCDSSGAGLDG